MSFEIRKFISILMFLILIFVTSVTSVFAGSISELNVERIEGNKITLENMIVKITNDDVEIGEDDVIDPTKDMTMRVDFTIPDDRLDIKKGDYLEVTLPEYLIFSELKETEIRMEVTGGNEVVLGNVTVSENKAILTFTEEVENEDYLGRGGWFSAGLYFDKEKVQVTEDKVVMTILGNDFVIKVNSEEEPEESYISIEKSGTADVSNGEITWTIKAIPSEEDKTYDDYVINDTLAENLSLVEDSFEINPSEFKTDNFKYDKETRTIEYKFDNDIKGTQIITYKTKIKNIAEKNNQKIKINNTANLTSPDTTTSAAATVELKPSWVKKWAYKYNVETHSIEWGIGINASKAILKNVVATDVLADGTTVDVVKIKGKNKNKDIVLTNDSTAHQYYTLEGQTLKVHLGDIDDSVTISLTVKLDDAIRQSVHNEAEVTWKDEGSSISGGTEGSSASATGKADKNVTDGFIEKSLIGKYDFKNNETTWKIAINQARQEIENVSVSEVFIYNKDELSNFTGDRKNFSDEFGKYKKVNKNFNMKFIEGTLDIEGLEVTKIPLEQSFTEKGQYKLKTIQIGNNAEAQILEIYFGDIDSKEEIVLKTKYTDIDSYGVNDKNNKFSIQNNAYLYYGDGNSKLRASAKEEHYRCVLEKDHEGSYNYVDRTFTWKLYVNHNDLDIDNAVIIDNLPKYWDVDGENFYEIYHGGDVKLEKGVATIAKGTKLTEAEVEALIEKVEITGTDESKTIKFNFKNISDKYVILIKTKLSQEGADKQFNINEHVYVKNNASITGSTISGEQETSSSIGIWNSLISKDGELVKDSEEKYTGDAKWIIEVNRNAINLPVDDLEKVYVIDRLENYLEPKMNGENYEIRMWEMKLTADGRWDKDVEVDQDIVQSGISYENKDLKIRLPEINGSYRIELITTITSDTVTELNNSAYLEGVTSELVTKEQNVKIEYADGGAWANLAGKIKVTKTAENTGETLKGAVFELYEIIEESKPVEVFKYKKMTDENGNLTFNRLKQGKYKLVEVVAPIGYELDSDSSSRIIEIDNSSQETRVINENITNKPILRSIQLLKTDELENPLENAEFTLYKEAIEENNIIEKQKSELNGSVTFKDVKMGTYYVVETKAPKGYLIDNDSSIIKAVVDKDGNVEYFKGQNFDTSVGEIPIIKNIAYKGNITISKVDKNGNPLVGATFTLYDGNKTIIATAVSEGDEGIAKFENIRLGNYTIKETSAPSGYKLNDKVLNILKEDFVNDNVEFAFSVTNEKKSRGGGGSHHKPKDDPKVDIPDEDVPLAQTEEEIENPENKEKEKTNETIEEENVPLGTLPATGGIPQEIFWGLGAGFVAIGEALRRKTNKDNKEGK